MECSTGLWDLVSIVIELWNHGCYGIMGTCHSLVHQIGNEPGKDCAEDYGGPREMSEPETRNIMSYFRVNAPIIGMIDWHSYGDDILHPWGNGH